MAHDGALMAAAVTECTRLFDPLVVCVNLDPTVWAQACGCEIGWDDGAPIVRAPPAGAPDPDALVDSERVQVVFDAITRVKGAFPAKTIACGVSGPATLATALGLDQPISKSGQFMVGELITEATRALCENGVDLIVIMEDPAQGDAELENWISGGHYGRIHKVAHHYSVETLLLSPGLTSAPEDLNALDYVATSMGIVLDGFGTGTCDSDSIALGDLDGSSARWFLTTAWDVDPAADLGALQHDMKAAVSAAERLAS